MLKPNPLSQPLPTCSDGIDADINQDTGTTTTTATSDQKSYQHLALLSFICITNFGGYPQIYKPILDIIQVNYNCLIFY
jgi:hypothetical protein